ncbi:MAG: hypothetical protein JO179_14010 [Solirubrobacterales bacterium]|nr:hypothetical protein [Solirubrobacterales bacterium]
MDEVLVMRFVVLAVFVAVVVTLDVDGGAEVEPGGELEDLEPPQPPRVTASATMTKIHARPLTLFSIDSAP